MHRSLLLVCLVISFCSLIGNAQTTSTPGGNYNYTETFATFFYSKNLNEYRSASCEPGPRYW
ncbi:MAG: hypothetical protein ACKOOA_10430, partial [Sediminibacterium sp.]